LPLPTIEPRLLKP